MAVEKVTDENFESALSSNDYAIVKYYADWCGSCKLLAPKYKRLSEDERFQGIKFLEVNAEEDEIARRAASVDNLPFFATFLNGKLVSGSATAKEEGIVALLENLKK